MMAPTISDYLKYANLQMAAEAFLVDIDATGKPTLKTDIRNALKEGNKHALRFTDSEATKYFDTTEGWTVLDQ